jgi:hypothetical protein
VVVRTRPPAALVAEVAALGVSSTVADVAALLEVWPTTIERIAAGYRTRRSEIRKVELALA